MRNYHVCLILLAVIVAVGVWHGVDPRGEIGTDLVFGWLAFLRRVIPRVEVRWDGVAMFVGALSVATVMAHFVLRGLYREMAKRMEAAPSRWRWRWSVVLVSSLVLMFAAGISFVGVTHQVAWLATSDVPLFGRSPVSWADRSKRNLKNQGRGIAGAVDVGEFPTRAAMAKNGHPQSWVLPILPYLSVYVPPEVDESRAWNDPVNAPHFKKLVPELLNPEFRNPPIRDAAGFGLNHYAGNSNLFDRDDAPPAAGDWSNTILIGEVNSEFVPWGQPGNSRDPAKGINRPGGFGGTPGGEGTLFLMRDGSVRVIDNDVDRSVLEAMGRVVE